MREKFGRGETWSEKVLEILHCRKNKKRNGAKHPAKSEDTIVTPKINMPNNEQIRRFAPFLAKKAME